MNATIDLKDSGYIVSALLILGGVLKTIPAFPNRAIPAATWLLGVIAYVGLNHGWTDAASWLAGVIVSASATGIHSAVKNTAQSDDGPDLNKPSLPSATKLGVLLSLSAVLALGGGCARFTTTQTDTSYEGGKAVRTITTRASALTLFEAKSALAQFKATQTDKTQSATVGSLNQESSGISTNAAQAAGEFIGGIIRASK